ncbi:MAG: hypothetical protein QOG20_4393 [Pseudonocardiales bacterium]|nr:hypothetical protein [Pseudonocardiales bacterium]
MRATGGPYRRGAMSATARRSSSAVTARCGRRACARRAPRPRRRRGAGDHHDRPALGLQPPEQLQHLEAALAVERARRLVGRQQGRLARPPGRGRSPAGCTHDTTSMPSERDGRRPAPARAATPRRCWRGGCRHGTSRSGPELPASAERLAAGVDVLLHDARFTASERQLTDAFGHAAVDDAVDSAARCGVRGLVLTHDTPGRTDDELDRIARYAAGRAPGVTLGIQGRCSQCGERARRAPSTSPVRGITPTGWCESKPTGGTPRFPFGGTPEYVRIDRTGKSVRR